MEFLTNCCLKANLPPDSWLLEGITIKVFEGEIFEEIKPAGKIRRKLAGT
jgi:AMMECR1 domain-containing protein